MNFGHKIPIKFIWSILMLKNSLSLISSPLLDRSPAFLISDDFVRPNGIVRTKWPDLVLSNWLFWSNNLMISSERFYWIPESKSNESP